jgi:hypothetical protein
LSLGAKKPQYPFGTLLWTNSAAWRTREWHDGRKVRPGLVVAPSKLLMAPCSTKLEYASTYEEHEIFRFGVDDVEWEPYADLRDGFAAFWYLHPVDPGYIGARAGVLVPAASERLRVAYAELVKRQSGDNG